MTLVINLRLLLYSAALAPHWRGRSLGFRLVAAHLLIDPSFIHAQKRNAEPGSARTRAMFYLGGATLLWLWWQLITGIGILAPGLIPHLGVLWAAAPLCFVALLAGTVKDRSTLLAAGTALIVSTTLGGLPMSAGLGIALIAGLLVASVGRPADAPHPAVSPTHELTEVSR